MGTEKGKCKNTEMQKKKIENVKTCEFSRNIWDIFKQIQSQYAKHHAQPIKTTFVGLNDCRVSQT